MINVFEYNGPTGSLYRITREQILKRRHNELDTLPKSSIMTPGTASTRLNQREISVLYPVATQVCRVVGIQFRLYPKHRYALSVPGLSILVQLMT